MYVCLAFLLFCFFPFDGDPRQPAPFFMSPFRLSLSCPLSLAGAGALSVCLVLLLACDDVGCMLVAGIAA